MITICSLVIHYAYASSISKARFPSNLLNSFQNKIHKVLFNKNDREYIQNNDIMNLMIGKYDNQYQMYMNQKNGKFNSKDAGHEYVNVLIKQHPIESNVLIAAYYLNNNLNNNNATSSTTNNSIPFRFRYYQFIDNHDNTDSDNDDSSSYIRMKIFRPLLHTNQLLKDNAYNLNQYIPSIHDFEELFGCDIGWQRMDLLRSIITGTSYIYIVHT